MILHACLGTTIITIDPGLGIFELWWHGLSVNRTIELLELHLHVDHASAAYRAPIGILHVFVVAQVMNAMTTRHEDHSLRGCKHIFAAYRTVAINRSLDASVGISNRYRQASTTRLDLTLVPCPSTSDMMN